MPPFPPPGSPWGTLLLVLVAVLTVVLPTRRSRPHRARLRGLAPCLRARLGLAGPAAGSSRRSP